MLPTKVTKCIHYVLYQRKFNHKSERTLHIEIPWGRTGKQQQFSKYQKYDPRGMIPPQYSD